MRGFLVVRVAGFEPTASWTRTKRDTKLRHTRITFILYVIYERKSSIKFADLPMKSQLEKIILAMEGIICYNRENAGLVHR